MWIKRFVITLAALYLVFIALSGYHAYAASSNSSHVCKNAGAAAHRCRHISADGRTHVDKSHDGNSNLRHVAAVSPQDHFKIVMRQIQYAAVLGFFQDDASVPPECSCMVSCFLGGDGLPSPGYPND